MKCWWAWEWYDQNCVLGDPWITHLSTCIEKIKMASEMMVYFSLVLSHYFLQSKSDNLPILLRICITYYSEKCRIHGDKNKSLDKLLYDLILISNDSLIVGGEG